MELFLKLFTPLNYLKIEHKQKRFIDFTLPIVIGLLTAILYVVLPKPFIILGGNGMIFSISSLIQFLTGFYVASLAVIATFPNKNMDVTTDGIPLKLNGVEITRRQYLSYMFGYLAFLGFHLVLFGFLIKALEPSISVWILLINSEILFTLKIIFIIGYFHYLSRLLLTTLYGLYYLTDKIHQTKSELEGEIGSAQDEEDPEDF